MAETFDACLYHANCPDGFGAAYAAWKAGVVPSGQFLPAESNAKVSPPQWRGKRLLLVDFCWLPETMAAVAGEAESILVLDHHQSAADAFKDFSAENVKTIFDMSKSGATLAWSHFHPGKPTPELLAYVEDYDLWRHRLEGSSDVNLALTSRPFKMSAWDDYDVAELRAAGREIGRWLDVQIERVARSANRAYVFGHEVPCVNAPRVFVDRLGNRLAAGEPFAIVWAIAGGKLHVSLRSRVDGIRVDRIAVANGGRGHPHAAIVSLDLSSPASRDLMGELLAF